MPTLDNNITSLENFAIHLSKGNNIIWFVGFDKKILKIELESKLISQKLTVDYYKTNVNYSIFDAFYEYKLIENKKEYPIKCLFLDYFRDGYFFYNKKAVVVYLIESLRDIYDNNKKLKIKEFIKNHPEYIL